MAGRLLTWSLKSNTLAPLVPMGMGGGESDVYAFESDPQRLAAVPVQGSDADRYFAKARALESLGPWADGALPQEILVAPKDKKTPIAVAMTLLPGEPLETIFFPAERAARGLDWALEEWSMVGRSLTKLFSFTGHRGATQNDNHPGNFLLEWDPKTGAPRRVTRVDTQSFGFWHQGVYYGCDKARWEYVPPELQRLGRRPEGLRGFEVPRTSDWFGLACLLFECLVGCRHCDYRGGDPDVAKRVEKKQFAVMSMPAGATVPDDVEAAYYSLPAHVTAAFEAALMGDPKKRPSPADWMKILKSLSAPKTRSYFLPSLSAAALVHGVRRGALALRPHLWSVAGVAALAGAGALTLWPGDGSDAPAAAAAVDPAPAPVEKGHYGSQNHAPLMPPPQVSPFPKPKRASQKPGGHTDLNTPVTGAQP